MAKARRKRAATRTLDALPDTVDFRDKMFVPTLVEVPPESDLGAFRQARVPVLDQGREGACTGFGLATVVNYLLRAGRYRRDADEVSARMLYVMARRYDEWPGEKYEGSSARGAVKGWHKHGACARRLWRDDSRAVDADADQAADALKRPLGAYFRVNHKDLVGMHSAIAEAGILFATARVHTGWMDVKTGDTDIRYSPNLLGGHAFAIVGFDRQGFWIQNSWGPRWGSGGLARIGYSDWLENGTDVWVARLGAPVDLRQPDAAARMRSSAPRSYESYVYAELRPHIVVAGNDGKLSDKGTYGLTREGLRSVVRSHLPKTVAGWSKKRVLLYAHGGLVPQDYAVQYVANYRADMLAAEVYPLAVIWRSDAWTTIGNILKDAMSRRRDEGVLDAAKDFMLDRVDDMLEPVARQLGGKALWDEMKENATAAASKADGAARLAAGHLADAFAAGEIEELHLAGHSAGAVLLAPLAKRLADSGMPIRTLTLWAPACTIDLFNDAYVPLIEGGGIENFDLYTLDDKTERDDTCRNIYNKSLLYLVSAAFEEDARIPLPESLGGRPGTPLLGLARDVEKLPKAFWRGARRRWIVAPGDPQSDARHHGDFDNDEATLIATLERITGGAAPAAAPLTRGPAKAAAATRRRLNLAVGAGEGLAGIQTIV
jgi:hypothetical protein